MLFLGAIYSIFYDVILLFFLEDKHRVSKKLTSCFQDINSQKENQGQAVGKRINRPLKKSIFCWNPITNEHYANIILKSCCCFGFLFYWNVVQYPFIVIKISPKCKMYELCYCKIHVFLFDPSPSDFKKAFLRISKIQNDRL